MNRKLMIGAVSAAIVFILVSVIVFNASSIMGGDEEEIIIIEFDHQMAGNHVSKLVQWGPRMTGSQAELNGAEYIASQFEEAGLEDVHIEEYQVPMFEVRRAEVSLIEYRPLLNVPKPLGNNVRFEHITEFVLQGYSGSLNWRNFRDDLDVYNVGNGTDTEAFSQTRGKVCFIEQTGDTPPNSEVYFNAYEAGARAIILQNVWRGESLGYLPMFKTNQNPIEYDEYPDIPFFMVSKDMGDEILDGTSSMDYKLRIDFDVRIDDFPCRVVVGDIKGSSDEILMFTAHHDTCYNTIGAIDNTVGPASLIEIARSLSRYDLKHTVRFATFGGEEEGLYGAKEYQKAHSAELDGKLKMVMNFDMAHTDTEAMRVAMVTDCNKTLSKLERIKSHYLKEEPQMGKYEIALHYGEFDIPYSDYWPFTRAGANGIAAWGSGCEEYHTYLDNMDHLNPESLALEGQILGSYALMAAT
jgi:hypothetical protein